MLLDVDQFAQRQRLGVSLDVRQRRPQLVRRRADKLRPHFLGQLLLRHIADRPDMAAAGVAVHAAERVAGDPHDKRGAVLIAVDLGHDRAGLEIRVYQWMIAQCLVLQTQEGLPLSCPGEAGHWSSD